MRFIFKSLPIKKCHRLKKEKEKLVYSIIIWPLCWTPLHVYTIPWDAFLVHSYTLPCSTYSNIIVYLNTLYRFFTSIVHAHLLSIRKYYKDLFVKYKKNIRLVFLVTFLATKLFNISMGVSSKIWWKMVENISHHFKSFVYQVDPQQKCYKYIFVNYL